MKNSRKWTPAKHQDQMVTTKYLKKAKYALKEIVTHLFNICLTESFVPTQWKEANIITIPKIKEPKEVGD
jgi:hypothetical protein